MTDFGLTNNEMTSARSDATDLAVVASAVQPSAESTTPAATQLPSNPPTAVPVARKRLAVKKTPARKPKVAATKKAAAKKISPPKAKPAKPVATKSSARKAAVTKKATSAKVGVKAAAPKKTSPKKAPAKKTVAKKTGPMKVKAVKAVLAPPQVTLAASSQAASSESVRDAAKGKAKLVRDSFTMPQEDFGLIAVLKDRALGFKRPAKKSELLRAGLHALQQLTDAQLRGALDSLVPLKAGRPKKKAN
jgi:hypothetical protein